MQHKSLLLGLIIAFAVISNVAANKDVPYKIIIKACSWGIGRFPLVKEFIAEDLPKFGYKMQVDYKAGGNPRFSILDVRGIEIRVADVSTMNRAQLRAFVTELGIEPLSPLASLPGAEEL